MNNLAIIPARSGSKGLPNKNILNICGKPLMAYSIEAAIRSELFSKVFVSTDSQEYANIAKKYGGSAEFLRSKEMSSDAAGSWDVVREVVKKLERDGYYCDTITLLQPTSPLRTEKDIINAFNLFIDKDANAIESVTETDHSPLWCNTLPDDLSMEGFERPEYEGIPRQKLPKYYRLNGAIYIISRSELDSKKMFTNKCYAYIMPPERSIDIDSEIDFVLARILMNNSYKNEQGEGLYPNVADDRN